MNILPAALYTAFSFAQPYLDRDMIWEPDWLERDVLWCEDTWPRQDILRCEYENQLNGHGFSDQVITCDINRCEIVK